MFRIVIGFILGLVIGVKMAPQNQRNVASLADAVVEEMRK